MFSHPCGPHGGGTSHPTGVGSPSQDQIERHWRQHAFRFFRLHGLCGGETPKDRGHERRNAQRRAAATVAGKAVGGSDDGHKRPYAVLLVALAAICAVLSPVKEAGAHISVGTTVSAGTGAITPSDSSLCTVSAAEKPRDDRTMNENGPYALARSANAWIFKANCDDGANTFEIRVHEDFTKTEAASAAEKYGEAVGRLPKVLRSGFGKNSGINILNIHKGSHQWFGSSRVGKIGIYTEFATIKLDETRLEEGLAHEAAHVSLDDEVKSDPKWLAARKADGAFISSYAKNNPDREDVAESFLAYFSARYVPTRIDSDWKDQILQTIPNRIAYFDALLSADDMKPFTAAPVQKVAALPAISVAAKAASATEGAGAVFTVTASPAPTADLVVTLTVADDASSDFLAASDEGKKTVTITAGQSSADLTVPTQDDSADEADGSVTATIEAGSGYTPSGTNASASVAVSDNDAAPTACVPEQLLEKVEGYYDHNKARPPGYGANWFRALVALGARSPDGWTADSRTILPMTAADARAREANWFGWAPVAEALECLDGAVPAEPEITIAGGAGVTEGADAVFTVTASPAPVADLTVSLTVADDASSDFLAQADEGTQTVTINGGQASADLTLTTVQDSVDEADGSVTATVTAAAGYTLGNPSTATVAVADDDVLPAVGIAGGNAVTEGAAAVFTLTATPAPQGDITVKVNIADSGAFASSGAAGARQVTIGTSGTATLDVTTDDDGADEPDGSITATVEAGSGYTIGTSGTASVAVSDNDEPVLSVAISPASASEGDTGKTYATVTFGLDPVRGEATSFKACLKNTGTAARGASADYQLVGTGSDTPLTLAGDCHSYTLAANAASGTVRLLVRGDADVEPDETVVVELQDPPAGVTVSGTAGSATYTILNDDAAPTACVPEQLLEKIEGYYDHNRDTPPGYGANWFRALVALGARSPDGWTADSRTILPMTAADARAREANWFGWAPVADALECLEGAVPAEPEITIAGGAGVTEGADAVFTVTASPAPVADLTVSLTVADDASSDFLAQADEGTQTVTINGGQASADLTLTTVQDSVDEADGSVTATVTAAAGYTLGSPSTATVAVADDDVLPAVGIAGGNAVTEGAAAVFTLTATPAPQGDITVKVNIADSGAFASSGAAGARQVTIGTSGTATLDVTTDDDGADEPDGSITATVEAGSGYTIGTSGTASVAVSDNDEPVLSVAISPASASEGDTGKTYATVTFGLDPVRGEATSFKACLKNTGTAARGASADYQLVGTGSDTPLTLAGDCHSYTLAANAASGTVRLLVRGDADVEPDETVVVELQDPPAGVTVSGTAGSATYTILNDDAAPTACVPEQLLEKIEGYYDHNRDTPPGYGANWFRALVALGARSPDGWTADSRTILPMTAADARAREANWFGWAPVADALECLEGAVPAEPEITIAGGAGVTEGADAVFTVTASPAPVADLTVSLTVADDASSDFLAQADEGTQTVTINGGQASADLTLTTVQDSVDEADGSVTATVTAAAGYTLGSPSTATVAVADDDVLPSTTPELILSGGSAITEGGNVSFTITASPAPGSDLTVAYTVAQSGDYLAAPGAGARTVTLAAGATSAGIEVATVDDSANEADGSVSAALAGGTGYTVASGKGSRAVTVTDNDTPVVSITAGNGVTEGTDASFTITASPVPGAPLDVALTIAQSGDMAASGEPGSRTVTIPVSGSLGIDIATVNDAVDEPDGSITASVNAGDGYTVGSPSSQTVAVADDDAAPATPILSLSAGSAITEGGSATFTITADPAPSSDLTIAYSVAQSGEYLAAPGAGARTVTLAAGATSAGIEVATVDDTANEADGSVSVALGTGTGYSIAAGQGSAAVAVTDNDIPALTITAGPGVTEGEGAAFTITADPLPAAPLDVTLTITQSGQFAASGQLGSRTVTIPVSGSQSVTVATVDDAADEPNGAITAALDAGTGYTVATAPGGAATVTIADNDTPSAGPAFSVGDETAGEDVGMMYFTVRLDRAMQKAVKVTITARESNPVSARYGEDFQWWWPEGIALTFWPGQTEKKMPVYVYNDSHDEDPETFEVVLSSPTGGAVIADGLAIGTITNSDPMPAAFLSRFGRTVAQQALDGIESRIAADRAPGTHATIAGQALALGTAGHATGASPLDDLLTRPGPTDTDPFDHHPPEPLSMSAREALLSSSFTTTGETEAGSLAIWGRAARDSFDGQEGSFSLDGTATTAMLGADYGRDRWLLGLALLHSSGKGSYADTDIMPRPETQICPPAETGQAPCAEAIREGDGKIEASLTAVLPYASIRPSERLRLWGALGHGTGEVTLTPETGDTLTADTSWQMAAAGMRAELTGIGSGTLALTSDALWSRTRSEKTHALAASDATVTRLRAGLEATWQIGLESGATLTPGLEVGARHDGGDAERGAGIEVGGSLAWTDPASGFAMDLSARKLIAHDDDEFEENGLAASFTFDPRPESARGLSVSLRQDAGETTGGVDALFMPEVLAPGEGGGAATTAEAAYGLPALAGRFTIAPHARLRMDNASRDYTLGWRLTPERGAPDLSLGLEATRREHGAATPVHGVGLGMTLRW